MSSVRTAVLKLAAIGAGAALVGGGAVHVAEKAASGKPHYVKHAKHEARPAVPHSHDKRVAVAPPPPAGQCCRQPQQVVIVQSPPGATAVPAPPMLVLFGAAAAGVLGRRRKAAAQPA